MKKGRVLSHYELIEKVGEGGMGVVWRARDSRLGREVAIKLLPESCTADPKRLARFQREARLASQLSHPNIATIYEAGDDDGIYFIAMELIRGETLAERVCPGGLPASSVRDLASAMAAGLAEAHRAGIVHRDLKPANVMLDDRGRVKILDFGLSRPECNPEQLSDLTVTQQIIGTLHYMSPEQIRGEAVDGRSDLFALGATLYELATGVKAFEGASPPTVMNAVLEKDPPPLMQVNPHVGEPFAKIVERLLSKDPGRRPASADEVVAEMARIRSGATGNATGSRRRAALVGGLVLVLVAAAALLYTSPWEPNEVVRSRLVVLPFASFGPPEGEVVAAAISQEIRHRLEVVPGLAVMYRTSSVAYRDKPRTLAQIGADLGVDYVLDGNVYLNQGDGGDEIHVQPMLKRVSDGSVLLQRRYERDLDNVLAVQAEIARLVVEELGLKLLDVEQRDPPTRNLKAYRAYLRATTFADSFDPHVETNRQIAVGLYQKATKLDPEFALAWAELSWSHSSLHWWGHDRSDERLALAKAAVDEALALDPDLPEARMAVGRWHQAQFQYDRALEEYALVQRTRPNSVRMMTEIASIWSRQGRFDDAAELFEQAQNLSPRDAFIIHEMGEVYLPPRKFAEAERFYDRSISLAPDLTFAYACQAHGFWLQGRVEDAEGVIAEMPTRSDPVNWRFLLLAKVFTGDFEAAIEALDGAPHEFYTGVSELAPRSLYEAEIHELVGREDAARTAYEHALAALEEEMERLPFDDRLHASLAAVYAGLGRDDDAIREARRAVELAPISNDIHVGAIRLADLAATLAATGRLDEAIDEIEHLLSIPSLVTPEILELDPRWRDVRNHPRLLKVVAAYQQAQ